LQRQVKQAFILTALAAFLHELNFSFKLVDFAALGPLWLLVLGRRTLKLYFKLN
jgi:hypothetical protein